MTDHSDIAALRERLQRAIDSRASSKWFLHPLTHDDARALLAALSPAAQVPRPPTATMITAGVDAFVNDPMTTNGIMVSNIWRAMYDAALAERGQDHQSDAGDENVGAKKAAMANNVLASRATCEDSSASDPTAPATPEAQSDQIGAAEWAMLIDDVRSYSPQAARWMQRARAALGEKDAELARAKPVIEATKMYVEQMSDENWTALREALRALDKEAARAGEKPKG